MKQLRGRTPKESKDCPENCWRCSQFCGETRSNSSSALQSYFFPLISRLPGQTHLFQGHCKTGQNSSASCDQMASQTLCTKLSLGSRHLNSVSPMPFLSLTQGNISEQQPSTFVLFSPALSSASCLIRQQVLSLALFRTHLFFEDTCNFFPWFSFTHKTETGQHYLAA